MQTICYKWPAECAQKKVFLTLLSVWSPSWTLRISAVFICPVTAAMNSTKAVLPHPIGPSRRTGFWDATASASLRTLRQVESTSTRSFGFSWGQDRGLRIFFFSLFTALTCWPIHTHLFNLSGGYPGKHNPTDCYNVLRKVLRYHVTSGELICFLLAPHHRALVGQNQRFLCLHVLSFFQCTKPELHSTICWVITTALLFNVIIF